MARSKSYTIAGAAYPKQSDLEAAVKAALNSHPMNKQFFDAFLAAVINQEHSDVRAAGQQATGLFEYLDYREQIRRGMDTAERYRGGNVVMALFEPLGEWRDVKVYPWRGRGNHQQDIKGALREILALHLPHPTILDRCARPACPAQPAELEYHHVEPEFDAIAQECMRQLSPEEIETRFGYSKFIPGRDELSRLIPEDHPAVRHMLQAHVGNQWEWLCKAHHRNVGMK